MLSQNKNLNNFLLAEHFNFRPILSFIKEKDEQQWKIEYIKIEANKVIFNNTNNSEEIVIVIGGFGGITIDGEISSLIKIGDIIHFQKNVIRSVANVNDDELLEVIFITINQ